MRVPNYVAAGVIASLAVCGIASDATAQRIVFFRNDLTTDVTIQLRAAGREFPTSLNVRQGRTAAFELVSDGPFDISAIPFNRQGAAADDVVFLKQAVDLQELTAQMNGNVISVKGVHNFLSARQLGGLALNEDRVLVTIELPLRGREEPLMGALYPLCLRNRWEDYFAGRSSIPGLPVPSDAPAPAAPP